MRQALQNKLQRNFNEHRRFENCDQTGIYEDVQILETNQFFHIVMTSPFGRRCFPLQEFDLTLSSGIKKKYQLECIIQRSGNNVYNGHYWSNIKNGT